MTIKEADAVIDTLNTPEDVLSFLQSQLGVSLRLCDHFTGIQNSSRDGKRYISLDLGERTWGSRIAARLESLSVTSQVIDRVEPNGPCRLAVFINN